MKFLISENQVNKLASLIEKEINYFLRKLQGMDEESMEDWVHYGSPSNSQSVERIFVKDLKRDENDLYLVLDLYLMSPFIPPDIDFVFDSIFSQMEPHFGKINYEIDDIVKPKLDW